MLQRELLSFYRDEVDRSKRWRTENFDDDWQRYCDLYRGQAVQQQGHPATS